MTAEVVAVNVTSSVFANSGSERMRTILCPQGIPWRQDCDSYDSSQMWSVRHGFDAKPQLESSFDASYFARWFHRSESSLDPC